MRQVEDRPDRGKDKTLTITDNGIGMNGRISTEPRRHRISAPRPSHRHWEKQQTNIPELIGQFGVGFYAAFMVAESVT